MNGAIRLFVAPSLMTLYANHMKMMSRLFQPRRGHHGEESEEGQKGQEEKEVVLSRFIGPGSVHYPGHRLFKVILAEAGSGRGYTPPDGRR